MIKMKLIIVLYFGLLLPQLLSEVFGYYIEKESEKVILLKPNHNNKKINRTTEQKL